MIKMLCPDPESFSNKGLEYAAQLVNLTARKITQKHFEEIAPDYDCLLVRFNTIVGGEVFNSSSMVKSVISPTTGLDHIDMVTAKKNKVKVYHLRGQKRFLNGVSGTAELTIGLMLSVLRKIPQSFAAVKQSVWEPGPYRGNEVSGKTLGIIGCGRLGSKVARVGVALGMDVIAYDPYKIRFPAGVKAKNSLKQLLNISDIVTLHVPLTEQTRHMIAVEEIYEMKDEVVIINTSRGAIIETQSILDGLLSNKIAAVALDVIENERYIESKGNPLISYANQYDNLLITPHIGGATYESVEKTDMFILDKYFMDMKI